MCVEKIGEWVRASYQGVFELLRFGVNGMTVN